MDHQLFFFLLELGERDVDDGVDGGVKLVEFLSFLCEVDAAFRAFDGVWLVADVIDDAHFAD